MKLPSITYLFVQARESFFRFPLSLIAALVAVVVGVILVEYEKEIENKLPYINLMLCMALGIPLYFCVAVVSLKLSLSKRNHLYLLLGATLLLGAVFFTLPDAQSTHNISLPYIKYAIYNITLHLFVSFLPFIFSAQLNGFWQYNKILFIRLWTSFLFSAALFLGLALAISAFDILFDIDIHKQLYPDLFIIIGGLVNTWIFVNGIPKNFDALEELHEYPRGLKIFSQYILLPLLAIYLVILYMYGGKILIAWNWPKGVVSYLIICISVLGILTFLLLHPYGNLNEDSWIKKLSKGYYIALFPLLIILFIAIYMRVADYGITINRYVIILLGVWLTIVCVYTAFGKTNIKFIPASLALMLLLMSFGPWGMFSLSERNQVARLKEILDRSGIMVSNKINNEIIWNSDTLSILSSPRENFNEGRLNDSLHNELRSILDYLDDHHGFHAIQDWFIQDLDSIVLKKNVGKKDWSQLSEAALYMKTMGLKTEKIYKESDKQYFNYRADIPTLKPITGYDYVMEFDENTNRSSSSSTNFTIDSVMYEMNYSFNKDSLIQFKYNDKTLNFNFSSFLQKKYVEFGANSKSDIPLTMMRLNASNEEFNFVMEFHALELRTKAASFSVISFSGELYIQRKRNKDN